MTMKKIITLLMLLASFAANINATVRYVKQTASGTANGTSWGNASGNLQAMINASNAATNDEVWVAAGTYKPIYTADTWNSSTSTYPTANGNRNNAFVLKEGVKIYGGFPADANDATHTSILTRGLNPLLNATTLSGDIGTAATSDNCYHVVIGASIANDGVTVLDGFTITGGNANTAGINTTVNGQTIIFSDCGGGIFINENSSPMLTNLIISENSVADAGGGIFINGNSSPTLTNVTISGNTAISGSGI
jgi:hypothetical protein